MAVAQPPAETCVGASLPTQDANPGLMITTPGVPTALDFTGLDFTGLDDVKAGCSAVVGNDSVVCYTPTNTCFVQFTCSVSSGTGAVSLHFFTGTCDETSTTCVNNIVGGTNGTVGPSFYQLTGGTRYCYVCRSADAGDHTFITNEITDCGLLVGPDEVFGV